MEVKTENKSDNDLELLFDTKDTELKPLWIRITRDKRDFQTWSKLLPLACVKESYDEGRGAFEIFLETYPLCYGYWKKYSDLTKRKCGVDMTIEIFERGVKTIPLSVDLWVHYLNFTVDRFEANAETVNTQHVRKLFNRAVDACGLDYRSDKLWDMFVNWEKSIDEAKNVTVIYDRLLSIPTQQYSSNFEKLKEHLKQNEINDVLPDEEYQNLYEVVAERFKQEEDANTSDLPPGIDANEMDNDFSKSKIEIKNTVKQKAIERRMHLFCNLEKEVNKIYAFEEGIKRAYFHVKPLEQGQLRNWRQYLDHAIESFPSHRTVFLFERALIACALYEEFWIKYCDYLSQQKDVELSRSVYYRACITHLPKRISIHMQWALFEEKQGDLDKALKIIEDLEEKFPNSIVLPVRRASLLRRHGDIEKAEALLAEKLDSANDVEQVVYFALKLSRFQYKILQKPSVAKETLEKCLYRCPDNCKIYLQLLDFEYSQPQIDLTSIKNLFNRVFKSDVSPTMKLIFSQRRLEFLEDFGTDAESLLAAQREHKQIIKDQLTIMNDIKKPTNVRADSYDAGQPQEKKPKVNPPATAATSQYNGSDYYTAWSNYYNYQNWPATSTQSGSNYQYAYYAQQ